LLVAAIAFDLSFVARGIRANTLNDTGKARTEDFQRKLFTLSDAGLERVAFAAAQP
jgi:hypothetical protein